MTTFDFGAQVTTLVTTLIGSVGDILTAAWPLYAVLAGIGIVFLILRKFGIHH